MFGCSSYYILLDFELVREYILSQVWNFIKNVILLQTIHAGAHCQLPNFQTFTLVPSAILAQILLLLISPLNLFETSYAQWQAEHAPTMVISTMKYAHIWFHHKHRSFSVMTHKGSWSNCVSGLGPVICLIVNQSWWHDLIFHSYAPALCHSRQ